MNLASSRLAAKSGIRHVEALVRADRAADAAERAVRGVWRDVLALLRSGLPAHEVHRRAIAIFRRLKPAAAASLHASLAGMAQWGHRTAARNLVQTLPRPYLQAAVVKRLTEGRAAAASSSGRLYARLTGTFPDVRQAEDWSCGAAAFRAVCLYLGVGPDDEAAFRGFLGTDPLAGTSPDQIIRGAKRLALKARPYWPLSRDDVLADLRLGRCLLCPIQSSDGLSSRRAESSGHWVVIIAADLAGVTVHDPVDGRVHHDWRDFEGRWHDRAADGQQYIRYGIAVWRWEAGHAVLLEDRPSVVDMLLNLGNQSFRDIMGRLREPVAAGLSQQQARALFQSLLFPPPDERRIASLMNPLGRESWHQQLDRATSLARPEILASILSSGMAAGKNQREIARELLPHVDGVRTTARRIARTEGVRIAHAVQHDADEQLGGDMVVAYQLHAVLSEHSRPWHAHRNGQIYYRNPQEGQKGFEQMPHPPEEPEDPSERPPDAPKTAYNCRCFLAAVLSPPSHIERDPAAMAVFANAEADLIPDPLTYTRWFDATDERRRRLAVGSRRYSEVQAIVGERPSWHHFVDSESGGLLAVADLRAESAHARAQRVAAVQAVVMDREKLLRKVATFGFLPSS